MKTLKYFVIVLACFLAVSACQKELSLESGFAGTPAVGSLLDTSGECRSAIINGVYRQDSTVGDSNYVYVQVNFSQAGVYNIFTDTQNGFSFADSGYTIVTGTQLIKLKAKGKPITPGTTTFSVFFDTSLCSFTVNVTSLAPATYSLVGSPGNCSNAIVSGTYHDDTALTAANRVALAVNVTTPGAYNIATPPTGGMIFAASGTFTTTGVQTIVLQGIGTPTTPGVIVIPVTAGTSNCSFTVSVAANAPDPNDINLSDSAWEFHEGTKGFNGPFFDVVDTTITGIGRAFMFVGYSATTGDTILQMGVVFPTGTIQTGTFNSNTSAYFYFDDYTNSTAPDDYVEIYYADPLTSGSNLNIVVTAYDAATQIVTGTFSGTVLNNAGTAVSIASGKFRAKVRPS